MKTALKAIGWLAGILMLLFGILIGVNAFDEDLSPESEKLLAERKSDLKDEDNAFFALWGLTAAEGADSHAVGKRVAALVGARMSAQGSAAQSAATDGRIRKVKTPPETGTPSDRAKGDR